MKASNAAYEMAKTQGIEVQVQSFFVPEQSDPNNRRFFFSYHIRIRNEGSKPIQVLSRHWIITDGHGRTEEVRGTGVVGQQPHLAPGEEFEYESFCPLSTPTGTMRGTFQVAVSEFSGLSGLTGMNASERTHERVDVEIPQFFLVEPSSFH